MVWCWGTSAFLIWYGWLCLFAVTAFWSVCTLLSVKFPWRFLSLCYNRTGAFLVAGFYLITYDLGFVILLVNLLGRLTCISLFVLVFHPLWLVSFYTVDVGTFSWVLALFCHCFLLTVLWPLCGHQRTSPTKTVHQNSYPSGRTEATTQWAKNSGKTTPTPRRRYPHPRCRTRPTTRHEKQRTNNDTQGPFSGKLEKLY